MPRKNHGLKTSLLKFGIGTQDNKLNSWRVFDIFAFDKNIIQKKTFSILDFFGLGSYFVFGVISFNLNTKQDQKEKGGYCRDITPIIFIKGDLN